MSRSFVMRGLRGAGLTRRGFGSGPWGDSTPPPPGSLARFGGDGISGWEAIGIVLACVKAVYEDFLVPDFGAYQGRRWGANQPIAEQPDIVTQPFGPDIDVATGMAQLAVSRLLRGNWYCAVAGIDPDTGFANLLTILSPDKCKPFPDPDTGVKCLRVNGFTVLKPGQFLHGQGLTMAGQMEGVDVLTAQRLALQNVVDVEAFGGNYFRNGGTPAGVVSVPGNLNRPKLKLMQRQWDEEHEGIVHAHRPAFLTNGAKWEPMSITPENAQFLETRRFNREALCGLFGVPLQRIQAIIENASQGGGRGIEGIDDQYVAHTLLAMGISIERVWDKLLPGGNGSWTRFDWSPFLRTAAAQRAQIAMQHRTGAIRTIDEIRADEGWAPLPGGAGSDPFTSLNSNKAAASEAPTGVSADSLPPATPTEGDPNAGT